VHRKGALLVLLIAACIWLAFAEGLVSAASFFVFGLVVLGGLFFILDLADAAGGFIDCFIRRFRDGKG
jgi:hypothetical protein